jgi:hypothetical protein
MGSSSDLKKTDEHASNISSDKCHENYVNSMEKLNYILPSREQEMISYVCFNGNRILIWDKSTSGPNGNIVGLHGHNSVRVVEDMLIASGTRFCAAR